MPPINKSKHDPSRVLEFARKPAQRKPSPFRLEYTVGQIKYLPRYVKDCELCKIILRGDTPEPLIGALLALATRPTRYAMVADLIWKLVLEPPDSKPAKIRARKRQIRKASR